MTGACKLLEASTPTSHAGLITDILDVIHGGGLAAASRPPLLPAANLSPSELRVLRYPPTNLTRPEIANALSISLNTVNSHVRRIYAKLGATDRSTAVRRSRELRLLSPEPT